MIELLPNHQYIVIKWASWDHIKLGYYNDADTSQNDLEIVSIGDFAEYVSLFGYSRISKHLDAKGQAKFYQLCLNFMRDYPEQFKHVRKDV